MRNVKIKKLKPRKKKVVPKPPTPEEQQLFDDLSAIVHKLGLTIRVEKGNFKGGVCVVKGEKKFLFVNKKHAMEQRIAILGQAIRQIGVEELYLPPRIREFIDSLPDEPLEVITVNPSENR